MYFLIEKAPLAFYDTQRISPYHLPPQGAEKPATCPRRRYRSMTGAEDGAMPFLDLIKNAIFEEEPQAAAAARPTPTASAPPASGGRASVSSASPSAATMASVSSDNQFYARLAKQTDFSAVPELAKIEAFAAPLASVIQEKSLRYKAALATAQSQAGLTRDAVLKSFDALVSILNSSSSTFSRQSDDVGRTEIDGKLAQISQMNSTIADKEKEIADLKEQMKAMQTQVEVSRTKLQKAKADFAAAYERRKAEIQQQRQDFENILQ